MYTAKERDELLAAVKDYLWSEEDFEGLVQMGSGAAGFRDIYSDIDLMAGCQDPAAAGEKLYALFDGLGAVYIHRRRWSDTVLGHSAYWENGLSVDISFMPTAQIPVLSDRIAILFSKTDAFTNRIESGLKHYQPPVMDPAAHHAFFFALRRCEIAVLRGEYIYADMTLHEARQILLRLHAHGADAKRFNALDEVFLAALEGTYPAARSADAISRAKAQLLSLYLRCSGTTAEDVQLKLIGCFDG